MDIYIGDKSQSYNSSLEEPDETMYICPSCGRKKMVEEQYELISRYFFPVRFSDTICECGEEMDRQREDLKAERRCAA